MKNFMLGKPNKTELSLYIFILLLLALASYATTIVNWDGGFPSGEFHLQIQNQTGTPIEGAKLNIYQGLVKQPAFGFVLAWAFWGIYAKQSTESWAVGTTAGAASCFILSLTLTILIKSKKSAVSS